MVGMKGFPPMRAKTAFLLIATHIALFVAGVVVSSRERGWFGDGARWTPLMASSVGGKSASAVEAAVALAAADRATGDVARTVRAIDDARKAVLQNLRYVDACAFKATRSRVVRGGAEVVCDLDLEQGSLDSTNRPLDVAIQGDGFFKVRIDDGVSNGFGFTRCGSFFVNHDGDLVVGMGEGCRLEPRITLPAGTADKDITIATDGAISVAGSGPTKRKIGQLVLWRFVNASQLSWTSDSLYLLTDRSGDPIEARPGVGGAGSVQQGFLEHSNVDATREKLRLAFLSEWRATAMGAVGRPGWGGAAGPEDVGR
jgi:flagellar basal body rod protein FlgG